MTGSEMPQVGGLLLAAGGSRRLKTSKQLLVFKGKTLLRRAAEMLSASRCDPVVVVLGPEFERTQGELDGLPVSVCENKAWETGMSSSIRAGLAMLLETGAGIKAVTITLCDQPHVTKEHLDLFIEQFEKTGDSIIAAEYDGVKGVPALFSRELFFELSALEGDKGARELIRRNTGAVSIPLPEASFDIDTAFDAALLLEKSVR